MVFAQTRIPPKDAKNSLGFWNTNNLDQKTWPIIHHHHLVLAARISLTLFRHSSLSFIALGRSSGQQPVSSHSCWMYVRAGRPAFARPCVGIHKSTSLMSSSLLLQQCPACLVRLTWIVFVIGGRWPYSWCLVGCCRQDQPKRKKEKENPPTSWFFRSGGLQSKNQRRWKERKVLKPC